MVEKTQILKSAIHTFANLGIKRVSIDDICFNLSISKKTFYHHYHEKQALINDFIAAEFRPIFEEYEKLRGGSKSPLEIMIRYNQFLMELIRSKNPAVLYDLRQFYPENYEVYHEYRSELLQAFQAILESGIISGHFRKEIDAKSLAALRVTQLESILIPYPSHQAQPEQYHQQLFEHYIYGIAGFLGMGRFPDASNN
jgi:TetR/AcrR family transcriptional regulator, cholesterol catabolism regulator